jgi:hypothetical protein
VREPVRDEVLGVRSVLLGEGIPDASRFTPHGLIGTIALGVRQVNAVPATPNLAKTTGWRYSAAQAKLEIY